MAAATTATATGEQVVDLEPELEVAAILCGLKRILRARDRRRRRMVIRRRGEEEAQAPVIPFPSWGRRRLRSVLEDGKPAAAESDRGAASPNTPLVFPDSVPEEEDDAAKKAPAQAEWVVQEQRGLHARLAQRNAETLKQIEQRRVLLLNWRIADESLKQLHKVQQQEQPMVALRPGMAVLGLDLNAPADDEAAARARARAAEAAAHERYWHWQAQQHKAAATAEARRRRLGILRAKVPLVSCRTRRVVG